jgi:hypothetical protein
MALMAVLRILRNLGYKKGTTIIFFPTSFVIVVGSGIQDPRSKMDKNQGPGINIPDPQLLADRMRS